MFNLFPVTNYIGEGYSQDHISNGCTFMFFCFVFSRKINRQEPLLVCWFSWQTNLSLFRWKIFVPYFIQIGPLWALEHEQMNKICMSLSVCANVCTHTCTHTQRKKRANIWLHWNNLKKQTTLYKSPFLSISHVWS